MNLGPDLGASVAAENWVEDVQSCPGAEALEGEAGWFATNADDVAVVGAFVSPACCRQGLVSALHRLFPYQSDLMTSSERRR